MNKQNIVVTSGQRIGEGSNENKSSVVGRRPTGVRRQEHTESTTHSRQAEEERQEGVSQLQVAGITLLHRFSTVVVQT